MGGTCRRIHEYFNPPPKEMNVADLLQSEYNTVIDNIVGNERELQRLKTLLVSYSDENGCALEQHRAQYNICYQEYDTTKRVVHLMYAKSAQLAKSKGYLALTSIASSDAQLKRKLSEAMNKSVNSNVPYEEKDKEDDDFENSADELISKFKEESASMLDDYSFEDDQTEKQSSFAKQIQRWRNSSAAMDNLTREVHSVHHVPSAPSLNTPIDEKPSKNKTLIITTEK